MKYDKKIGKIKYKTNIEEAIKSIKINLIDNLLLVLLQIFLMMVSIWLLSKFVENNNDFPSFVLGILGIIYFGLRLIKNIPSIYNTEFYILGDKGVIIFHIYLNKKIKENKIFMFDDATYLEINQYIKYGMGPSFLNNILYINDNYIFKDHLKNIIHKESLIYLNVNDLNKQYKKEYIQALINEFKIYRITRKLPYIFVDNF